MSNIRDEIRNEVREEFRKEFQKEWEQEKRKNPGCNPESWWEERRMGMKFFFGAVIGLGIAALVFLFGWVVMLLWNWLMPEIFGLTTISYWQAWGLLILSCILFKGFPSDNDSGAKRGDRRRRRELRKLMDEEVVRPEEPAPAPEAPREPTAPVNPDEEND